MISEMSRELVSELSGMQSTAIDLLNDHIDATADAFGMMSYNFYCPRCQLDDIDSTVELVSPQDDAWHCDTCQTEHTTEELLPRHRIKDDVVNPTWDQLWIEKDDERRRIYENISDQKAELEEREFEQRREEIRSSADRIRDLRSRIRDLKKEADAAQAKVSAIGDMMLKYERIHEQRKQEFEKEVQSAFDEIDAETEELLEETRDIEQKRLEEAQKEAKQNAEMMREEERRREAEKFMAEQERADQRTKGNMQQQANLMGLINVSNKQRQKMLNTKSRRGQ